MTTLNESSVSKQSVFALPRRTPPWFTTQNISFRLVQWPAISNEHQKHYFRPNSWNQNRLAQTANSIRRARSLDQQESSAKTEPSVSRCCRTAHLEPDFQDRVDTLRYRLAPGRDCGPQGPCSGRWHCESRGDCGEAGTPSIV